MKVNIFLKSIITACFVVAAISCTKEEETIIIPKTLDAYKQELLSFVNAQTEIVNKCVVGYNKGDFRSSTNYEPYTSAYKAKLEAALLVLQKSDLSIPVVVKTNSTLAADGKNFQTNLYISDRRPLNDVIVECEALNTATSEGTETGQAPLTAKTEFLAAINAAKTVRNATTTIERQVADEVAKLTAAKQTFQSAIKK